MWRYSAFLSMLFLVLAYPTCDAGPTLLTGSFNPGTGAVARGSSPCVTDTIAQAIVGQSSGGGLLLEHGVWHSGAASTYVASAGALKAIGSYDGLLSIFGKPVTAGTDELGDFFYIEEEDRSSGIRIAWTNRVSIGEKVHITGVLDTTSDYERYIDATSVVGAGYGTVGPVLLINRYLGGQDFRYVPSTGEGQRGVLDGVGTNNIGLLVATTGKLGKVDPSGNYFYIDDGCNLTDGTMTGEAANVGVRVLGDGRGYTPAGIMTVIGISSCFTDGGPIKRLIRPVSISEL